MNLGIKHLSGRRKVLASGEVVTYYHYVMPDGKQEALGTDLDEARSIAYRLNEELHPDLHQDKVARLRSKGTNKNPPVDQVCEEFFEGWVKLQGYSQRSVNERRIKLNQYRAYWSGLRFRDLNTFELAQFLRDKSNDVKRQHRFLLIQLFNFAKGEGYYERENPANDLVRVKPSKRQRKRHTWDGFNLVKTAAPGWLQNAMDLALFSLQRRSDLVSINTREHVSIERNTITIQQQKTDNYGTPVFIEIDMGHELRSVVGRCLQSGIACPYLVHCRPGRISAAIRATKPHPFAVSPDYLTRAYGNARETSEAYAALPRIEQPAFHDIRALGIWMYFKAGYPVEYIQALAGHATEAMTMHYQDGHEKPKPLHVEAGLSLAAVDFTEIDWQTELPDDLLKIIDDD